MIPVITMLEINSGIVIFLLIGENLKNLKFVKNYNVSDIGEKCREPVKAVVARFAYKRQKRV